ncbi:AEC family transporter [Protaetiibacter larvae]|uniref:AEC family transporter n=1 Tax=Protaetiibacter larvae TaxID=2592654 RepID=A0A5C1Y6Y4_9MICO|nr:AEC family transporter [Protaetiibacter larvae]QEO09410.1 AEC family transporter [Protaetiibacter larvae]
MTGVLTGFAIIGTIIAAGYLLSRLGVIGPDAGPTLSRLSFFILNPSLLLTVLATSDVHTLLSSVFVVSAIDALFAFALYIVIARLVLRRAGADAVLGGTAASYVNAGNIGLPIAAYVLGDPAYSAPVLLFQLVVFAPIVLTSLDVLASGHTSVWRVIWRPLVNPLLIASGIGVTIALTGWEAPAPLLQPFEILGGAAVPAVLLAFGMSLHGQRPFQAHGGLADIVLASVVKLLVMPVLVFLLARYAFGMEGDVLFAVTVLAALPSAQNVFTYAQRYERSVPVVRDTVLVTTVLSVPVIVVIALFR